MRFALVVRAMLLAMLLMVVSGAALAQVRVAIAIAPPVLPIYEQPICPGDGYIWTPGYWDYDYDGADYFWVPGTWVLAPEVGFLWTPPYWGWNGSGYFFYDGYWGPVVGFYGGINYGFGYFGTGFVGGRWDRGHFFYNTAVWHVGEGFHNVYNERVEIRNDSHVSFNGHGGIDARPTPEQEAAAHERHIGPVAAQTEHLQAARADRDQRASVNHGRPGVVATAKPGDFKGGAVRGGEAGRAENGGGGKVVHPKDLPPMEHRAAPNTGDAKKDQKFQQEQEKLQTRQTQERDKLQQQQEKEHQQLAKQKADDARTQQVEQKHQQQTEQLQQRHTQQTQHLEQKQAPAPRSSGGSKPK